MEADVPPLEPPAPAPPPTRKKRRFWPWLLALFGAGLLGLGWFVVFLPRIITGERIRPELVSALTDLLGVPVAIGSFDYDLFTGFELTGLVIGPPPGYEKELFTADRLAAKYDLTDLHHGRVTVQEVALERPIVTLEKKNGLTGLDVVLLHLKKDAPAAEPTKPSDAPPAPAADPGPLLGQTIVVEHLHLGPLTAIMVGEGPNVTAGEVTLDGHAQIDPERLTASFELTVTAPAEQPNLLVAVPPSPGGQAIAMRAKLVHRSTLVVDGQTSRGLVIDRIGLGSRLEMAIKDLKVGDTTLPSGVLKFSQGFEVRVAEDRLLLPELRFHIDELTSLDAKVELTGLRALLDGTMGPIAAAALASNIGLVGKSPTEHVVIEIATFGLPLDRLSAYAAAFVPGLVLSGRIGFDDVRVEGRVAELIAGTPPKLAARLSFADVAVRDPAHQVVIEKIEGDLILSGKSETAAPYQLAGGLDLYGVRQGPNLVPKGRFEITAGLEALAYPPSGETSLGMSLEVLGVAVPGVKVDRATVSIGVSGRDLLDPERAGDPIKVVVEHRAGTIKLAQGDGSIVLQKQALHLEALLDRLLLPTRAPIRLAVAYDLPSYLDPSGNVVTGLRLAGPLSFDDPRLAHFDLKGDLLLTAGLISSKAVSIEQLSLRLTPNVEAIGARHLARFFGGKPAPTMLPARATMGVAISTPKVDTQASGVVLGFGLKTDLAIDFLAATASVRRLELSLDDWMKGRLDVDAGKIYDEEPELKAKLSLERLDLKKALAKAPKSALGAASDLVAEGKLSALVEVEGRVPQAFGALDLEAPPLFGSVTLEVDDVSAQSAQLGNAVEDLKGSVKAALGRHRLSLDAELAATLLEAGRGADQVRTEGARFSAHAGLADRAFGAQARLYTEAIHLGGSPERLPGARFFADLTYPLGDDLELKTVELSIPAAGLEAKVWGRLARQTFGVFRPDLSMSFSLDVDALKKVGRALPGMGKSIASLGPASGTMSASLQLKSKSETRADLYGMLELADFSWVTPGLEVHGATGRLPIEQPLLLPTPTFDEIASRKVGVLGDDLEARLNELGARFGKLKAILDTENILVVAPRTADHQSLQPYYNKRGADLVIAKIVSQGTVLSDVHLEGAWQSGVLRVDRFQTGLWEGYFLGDFALQISADLDVRMRMRGVATNLNLDIPYAQVVGQKPVTDPKEKQDYLASGTLDLAFALRERAINGKVDVAKVSLPQVERLFGAMGMKDSGALGALQMGERFGVRPVAAKIWISQNLLNMQFEWQRLWAHIYYKSASPVDLFIDTVMTFARPLTVPTVGGLYIIPLVNNAIKRFGIGNIIDSMMSKMKLDQYPALVQRWVVARDEEDPGAVASP